jgi:hypothetical protein
MLLPSRCEVLYGRDIIEAISMQRADVEPSSIDIRDVAKSFLTKILSTLSREVLYCFTHTQRNMYSAFCISDIPVRTKSTILGYITFDDQQQKMNKSRKWNNETSDVREVGMYGGTQPIGLLNFSFATSSDQFVSSIQFNHV